MGKIQRAGLGVGTIGAMATVAVLAAPSVGVNQATIKWYPTTSGKHTITASQPLSSKSIDVTVSPANPLSSGSGGAGCAATGGSFG
ncbi:hypothetical protein [Nocardia seriolae]|uniref:Uncharacterized protein n=1 Tax=Nocardia seriolae TaxID=37332 RepID=A0A0B8N5N2_9NOCA|nr:hypothetical protein [Nocardia seriolae]APA99930.1 hypothetical protein NS506_05894 [Nocardia seriolae]MTJ64615.1 hypothetical protein [Nocardia seriolae]MTJ72116.1 hypothetical protein [Nocardia seriolae]MTJ89458.1 hypothetical protein [Nocardia seriolae]MTK33434.1 hypothetical protein [Nocardia seriolae]